VDILDSAQNYENQNRKVSIANARASISKGPGRRYCQNCEETISQARREAMPGCRLCIVCQTELENGVKSP